MGQLCSTGRSAAFLPRQGFFHFACEGGGGAAGSGERSAATRREMSKRSSQ